MAGRHATSRSSRAHHPRLFGAAPSDHNLPGITRHVVLREARRAELSVHEGPFTPADVERAEEAFVTGTSGGITPVRELDGRTLEVPGPVTSQPVTSQLHRLYEAALEAEAGIPADDERPRG